MDAKTEKKESLHEAGMRRLKMRVERLHKLMALDAPGTIVANEHLLIANALWLAYPDEMAKAIQYERHTNLKVMAGFCRVCDRPQVQGTDECLEHLNEQVDPEDDVTKN